MHLPLVVAPDFGHAEPRVKIKLVDEAMRDINLYDNVRRRVAAQSKLAPPDDVCGVLHVKAGVRLRALLELPNLSVVEPRLSKSQPI